MSHWEDVPWVLSQRADLFISLITQEGKQRVSSNSCKTQVHKYTREGYTHRHSVTRNHTYVRPPLFVFPSLNANPYHQKLISNPKPHANANQSNCNLTLKNQVLTLKQPFTQSFVLVLIMYPVQEHRDAEHISIFHVPMCLPLQERLCALSWWEGEHLHNFAVLVLPLFCNLYGNIVYFLHFIYLKTLITAFLSTENEPGELEFRFLSPLHFHGENMLFLKCEFK